MTGMEIYTAFCKICSLTIKFLVDVLAIKCSLFFKDMIKILGAYPLKKNLPVDAEFKFSFSGH